MEEIGWLQEQESFAGFTRALQTVEGEEIIEWRPVYESGTAVRPWKAAMQASVATEDRGLVQEQDGAGWIELDVDTRGLHNE